MCTLSVVHFSRYLPPGSRRVEISNTVVRERELTAEDVGNSQPLVFLPCAGTELQLPVSAISESCDVEKLTR